MDDYQRQINKAKRDYKDYSFGRLKITSDQDGMPVANKAAALELMHEREQTIARQARILSFFALGISALGAAAAWFGQIRALQPDPKVAEFAQRVSQLEQAALPQPMPQTKSPSPLPQQTPNTQTSTTHKSS